MGTPPVKGRAGRGSRSRATRRRIIDAAATRFVADGYQSTTLAEVAEEAGVAVQTVYFHFGNKRSLLTEVVDVAAAGDDEPQPVLERPWMDRLRDEPDPAAVVAAWAASGREIFERVAPIMRVVRDAATVDPEVAEQWEVNQQQRLVAFGSLAEILDGRGALRPGLTVDDATDVVFALNSLEVYLLLTEVRGWSPERWERWLAPTLAATLLAPTS